MTTFPTITITILNLDSRDLLLKQLQWMDSLYESLPEELQRCVYCLVSDNASKDDSAKVLADFAKGREWFSYSVQPEFVHVDINIITCYEKAKTDYVWLMAVDDYICSHENIIQALNLLKDNNVSGMTFPISPQRKICQLTGRDIKLISDPCDVLNVIGLGGKISCNIVRKIDGLDRNHEKIAPFICIGYMHSTLQAVCFELSQGKKFLRVEQQMVYSAQKWGDRYTYHPKYALNCLDSKATDYFKQNCPGAFRALDDKRILKLKWIIYQGMKSYFHMWDKEMLKDFVRTVVRESLKPPFSIKVLSLLIISLFFLVPYPYLLSSALNALVFNPETTVGDYRR
jgi:hypothetical protein